MAKKISKRTFLVVEFLESRQLLSAAPVIWPTTPLIAPSPIGTNSLLLSAPTVPTSASPIQIIVPPVVINTPLTSVSPGTRDTPTTALQTASTATTAAAVKIGSAARTIASVNNEGASQNDVSAEGTMVNTLWTALQAANNQFEALKADAKAARDVANQLGTADAKAKADAADMAAAAAGFSVASAAMDVASAATTVENSASQGSVTHNDADNIRTQAAALSKTTQTESEKLQQGIY